MQTFPAQLLEPNYTDPENPDKLVGRSEVERREQYFQLLDRRIIDGQRHPCVQLAKDCLRNSPSRRPTAEEIIATLEGMKADIEEPCGAVARADAVRQVRLNFRGRNRFEGGGHICSLRVFLGPPPYSLLLEYCAVLFHPTTTTHFPLE